MPSESDRLIDALGAWVILLTVCLYAYLLLANGHAAVGLVRGGW